MSKKRVHEIAKELKAHGIDLDNKEMVNELVAFGYDVKSHSSSLEDDQANEAVKKILDKRKPKAAPAPVAPKGFLVRRKVADGSVSAVVSPPPSDLPPPPPAATTAAQPINGDALPEPSAPPPAATQPEIPPADVIAAVSAPQASAPRASAPHAATAATSLPPPRSSAPRAPMSAGPASAVVTTTAPAAPPPSLRTTYVPGAPRASAPRTGTPVRPTGAQVIGHVDLGRLRPTATQAVVISRPLIQVKRVTPSSQAHKGFPMAPGRKAIGEVKEFKVVPDHLGRGKELVDVTKKQAGRGRGKVAEKEGSPVSQQDIRELVFGRVTIPIRGKKKKPTKKGQKTQITQMAADKKVIKLQEGITIADLSQRMGVKANELIKKLMTGGKIVTANQMIDTETAGIVATDYGWRVEKVGFEVEDYLPEITDKPEDLKPRPPVVTVMGHVDHGKTSLLDAIRAANVAGGEAGGITQHIGAYTVHHTAGEHAGDITFLDTPGHAAFSAMRARGANVTDIVVLVVAADDGVMPQTKEAIAQAKAAEVPIVVAMNKMDLAGANVDRVKKDLSDNGLLAEDWGGDVIMVPVSAKTKKGLDLLLENLVLQAEVLELTANATRAAVGTVIEAKLEKGRGPVATVLVAEGRLAKGDAIVTGTHYGRVRMMVNDRGEQVDELLPGYTAEVIGLSGVPTAGDAINAVEDEKAAKEIANHRVLKERAAESGKTSKESLEDMLNRMKQGEQKELKVVLKADVSGSLEAVAQAIEKLSTKKVKVTIVHKGVGMITETDINTAAALKALVIGFNSKPESGAEAAAKVQEVEHTTYGIIYELLDFVTLQMENLLEPIRTEKKLGKAEIRQLFNVPKLGVIAGSSVTEGVIKRSALARVWRDNKQVHTGKVVSLKRFKDDVKEVTMGVECGIGIENFSEAKAGDIIEVYEIEETRPSLN